MERNIVPEQKRFETVGIYFTDPGKNPDLISFKTEKLDVTIGGIPEEMGEQIIKTQKEGGTPSLELDTLRVLQVAQSFLVKEERPFPQKLEPGSSITVLDGGLEFVGLENGRAKILFH